MCNSCGTLMLNISVHRHPSSTVFLSFLENTHTQNKIYQVVNISTLDFSNEKWKLWMLGGLSKPV